MIPVGIAVLGLSLTLLTLWQIRVRRQNRLALRVLAGQRRLLGEEIDERLESLQEFDDNQLLQDLRDAPARLDPIHIGLLEQQARLQNLEDLAHLQRHKIAILGHQLQQAQAQQTGPAHDDPPPGSTQDKWSIPEDDVEAPPATRENLEDDLLGRIGQHAAPKEPRRRRGRPR